MTDIRLCIICQKEFKPTRQTDRTCSTGCAHKAMLIRAKGREERGEYAEPPKRVGKRRAYKAYKGELPDGASAFIRNGRVFTFDEGMRSPETLKVEGHLHCYMCHSWLEPTSFYRDRSRSCGRESRCRTCSNRRKAERKARRR